MKSGNGNRRIVRLIAVLLILAAAAYGVYAYLELQRAEKHANEVLGKMKTMIPGLGTDTGISTGQGRDPLVSLSIDGIDIVGCIEMPSVNLMAPVATSGYEEEGFTEQISVNGKTYYVSEDDAERWNEEVSKYSDPDDETTSKYTDENGNEYYIIILYVDWLYDESGNVSDDFSLYEDELSYVFDYKSIHKSDDTRYIIF